MTGAPATGGCACGAIRYEIASAPSAAGYCHCRTCQLWTGSPALAFAVLPNSDYRILQGEPKRWDSSASGQRHHCGSCGTPLTVRVEQEPDSVDLVIATLDDPRRAVPTFHIWDESRIGWFETADDWPRHRRSRNASGGS